MATTYRITLPLAFGRLDGPYSVRVKGPVAANDDYFWVTQL
jgi:hypothetical protein